MEKQEKQSGIKLRQITMLHYIGLIHKDPSSDYAVSFSDLPGCITAGSTLAAAQAMAEEALNFHLAGLAEDGDPIPEPSSLDGVMSDPNNKDGVAILVPVKSAPSRIVRVNITLPEDVLAKIDAYAERSGMNRSGFLVHAAKHEMQDADR